MQNINHFLIFSNTYNPKHTPPPPKKRIPPPQIPSKKIRVLRVLRAAPSAPKIPHHKIPHHKKGTKKIATRQAGSNHHIKQLLSLNQKI
ncbi:MAG: hypothetical protein SO575_08165 [Sodaliphilus sp.]|nr:hypothetical protein [Sodaliphilus sp.]